MEVLCSTKRTKGKEVEKGEKKTKTNKKHAVTLSMG